MDNHVEVFLLQHNYDLPADHVLVILNPTFHDPILIDQRKLRCYEGRWYARIYNEPQAGTRRVMVVSENVRRL